MTAIRSRKLLALFVAAFVLTAGLMASAPAQTVLFDFGNDNSFRGLTVPNPDANGNYWNSFQTGVFYQNLIDVDNNPTTIDFGFSTPVATDSFNGPAGPTNALTLQTDVTFTDIDAAALGILGGACTGLTGTCEGVFDFVASDPGVPVRFEIQQLDPNKTYNITFFGSHKFSTDNTTIYNIYTDNTYTTLVDSASLNHQDPSDPSLHNRDTVATITGIAPQTSNILYIEFAGDQGNNGYLNALLLEGVATALEGDFDGDGDVDGRDFLRWQRGGSPMPFSADDLEDWQGNYGEGTLSAFSAVPEPNAICLIFLAGVSVVGRRRTLRSKT